MKLWKEQVQTSPHINLKKQSTNRFLYIQMNPTKIYTTLARCADNSIQWLQVLSRVSKALAAESPEQASQPVAPDPEITFQEPLPSAPEKPKTGRGRPRKVTRTFEQVIEEAKRVFPLESALKRCFEELETIDPKHYAGNFRAFEVDIGECVHAESEVIVTNAEENDELKQEGLTNIVNPTEVIEEARNAAPVHTVDSLKLLIKPLTSSNADVRTELKETLLTYGESLSTMDPVQYPAFATAIKALLKKHNLK